MIELPEAIVIGRQMDAALKGKRIVAGDRGNAPHKFAFSSGTSEEYAAIFAGQTVGGTTAHGMSILTEIGADHTLVLGCGGERILFHSDESTLPKKHQLFLHFEDGTYLTVAISGWGNTLLLPRAEAGQHMHVQQSRITPLDDAFTWDYFQSLFAPLTPESKASLKYFLISDPGLWGLGNGCLQDILFHARLHPRRRAVETSEAERRALYDSVRTTLRHIVEQGGRHDEVDLYGQAGGYRRILYSKTVGEPCPNCGAPIEKAAYLGGSIYFCPECQVNAV
ncbi:MAG TPA: endonuclease VIII [Anaerolineae bacterium]|nr:endonuclease VIII [Anaerolineae bacterium]HQI87672.1 endonuclease VIII [Anaerolineae bacterium]